MTWDQRLCLFLGVGAAAAFLLAAIRAFSLRRYVALLDPGVPFDLKGARLRGIVAGRRTLIGFVPSGHRRPPLVQISVECSAPFRLEAHSRSLAWFVRKAVGVERERKSRFNDLDRRFGFQFDDGARVDAALSRAEVQQALHTLADLGAVWALLTNGRLTVQIPMTFFVPPGARRIAEALAAMRLLAAGTEAIPGPSPKGSQADPDASDAPFIDDDPWPAPRPTDDTIAAPVALATACIAMIVAVTIVGSFWNFSGRIPWQVRMALVHTRLPAMGALMGIGGFLAAFLVPGRFLLWPVQVSWPLIGHALIAAAFYLVLAQLGVPEIREAFGNELQWLPAGLVTAAIAAGVGLGAGLTGSLLGRGLSSRNGKYGLRGSAG